MNSTWSNLSEDPNSPAAQGVRRAALATARAPGFILDRERYLSSLVKGLNILDVGVVAHTHDAYKSESWLHRQLASSAASCSGCDILEAEVEHLRSLGFNIVCKDITKEPLDQIFDAIVCGELIEHLNAPGKLFENCAAMLRIGGRLVITTPNPWFLTYMIKSAFEGLPLVDSVDHTAWFDAATLYELAARQGFALNRYTGVKVTKTNSTLTFLPFLLAPILTGIGFRRELFSKAIVYEFTKIS